MSLWDQLFGGRQAVRLAEPLYRAIVAGARQPALFAELGVPDTIEGRFDALALHLGLVASRLSVLAGAPGDPGRQARRLQRGLFARTRREIDLALREAGIGDLTVAKQMRYIGVGLVGRTAALQAALAADDPAQRAEVLERNLYGGAATAPARLAVAGIYAEAVARLVAAADLLGLLEGRLAWPRVADFLAPIPAPSPSILPSA